MGQQLPAWMQRWHGLDLESLCYCICYLITEKTSRGSKGAYPLLLCHNKSYFLLEGARQVCLSVLMHQLSPSQKVFLHPCKWHHPRPLPQWMWRPPLQSNPGHLAASTPVKLQSPTSCAELLCVHTSRELSLISKYKQLTSYAVTEQPPVHFVKHQLSV